MKKVVNQLVEGDEVKINRLPPTRDLKHLELIGQTVKIHEVQRGNFGGAAAVTGIFVYGFPYVLNPTHYEIITEVPEQAEPASQLFGSNES